MRVDKITMPTLTKLMEIKSNAMSSLGLDKRSSIMLDIREFSDFKRSFSCGLSEKKADSELVVIAAKMSKNTIIEV
jgi:hypothetical protein